MFDDFDLFESYKDYNDENGYAREFEYVDEDWYYYDAFIDDSFIPN